MKINKLMFGTLILASAGLIACSSDDSSSSQSVNTQSPENQEMYDATQRPMDKARSVEKTIMDKAARDRKAMDDAEHAAHH
ncbi:MAG TPA: hypothetical protein ENI64_12345 [Gammaproteobacteria bacterium]|nr:hypothetical protein [Gammaproteobacteria bacterium]